MPVEETLVAVRQRVERDRSWVINTRAGAVFVEGRVSFLRRWCRTADRPPKVKLLRDRPDEGVARPASDRHMAVVILNRDPKLDDPALVAALGSEAGYVCALGPRRSHAGRRERLGASGVEAAALDWIYAPVGLMIGANTPAEVAGSIMAEIIGVRRRRPDWAPDSGAGVRW